MPKGLGNLDDAGQVNGPLAPPIDLNEVTLCYGQRTAIHQLTLRIEPASLLALTGPNGAGKSTLIKALAGELRPQSGILSAPPRHRIAWLPQHSELDRSFPMQVRDMVAMGLWHRLKLTGRMTPELQQEVDNALTQVGLLELAKRNLDALSGGQVQRALFARLILQDASVVLLDEPFASIDSRTTAELQALLHHWQQQGKTVVVVLHDLAHVRTHFPHTLILAGQQVAFGRTQEVLTDANWARAHHLQQQTQTQGFPGREGFSTSMQPKAIA